jgi:CTP:molybdopterin cytidylyltransferase MocA
MSQRPLAAVVLAAGQGKRMRAPVPKVLIEACGLPLVEHVLDALAPLEPERTVVVYGHGGDLVKEALEHRDCSFAHQPEQKGTGDAVRCASSSPFAARGVSSCPWYSTAIVWSGWILLPACSLGEGARPTVFRTKSGAGPH